MLIHLNQVSAYDSITLVQAYAQLRDLYPEYMFKKDLLDSAHDTYAIYRMLNMHEIESYRSKRAQQEKNSSEEVDQDGIPVYQAGLRMLRCGMHKRRQRIKWRCPKYDDPASYPRRLLPYFKVWPD